MATKKKVNTVYVEPAGYFTKEMQEAFDKAKKQSEAQKKKNAGKGKKK